MKKAFPRRQGFTLIELMVSVAIFTVVMVIALGALLSISAAERKAETLKSVMNNLSFALEGMSRTIRTGLNYHCDTSNISGSTLVPQNCPNASTGANYFAVQANDGTYVAYCLAGSSLWRLRVTDANLLRTTCSASDGFLPITATEVVVSNLTFYALGTTVADNIQPKVIFTLNGYVSIGSNASSTFNLQTSVTQRIYDQ